MRWTERQRALLREIGLQPWGPASASPFAPRADDAVRGPTIAASTAAAAVAATGAGPARPAGSLAARAGPPPATAASAGLGSAGLDSAAAEAPNGPPVDRSAVAALDWPALREAVAGCRACELCATRKQTVFGVGHPAARWMVIGEAPGQQEDEQGEPFVGAAGQLLDAMLRSIGLTRAADGDPARRVFIANTLKCRPPGNRNPKPEEMAQCEPFLVRQIELVKPALILAMGRFAVQALLRSSEPIGKLRGRVHRYEGVPLVVTYHPAYLLRNLPDKARAWEDLCLALDVAEQAGLTAGTTTGA